MKPDFLLVPKQGRSQGATGWVAWFAEALEWEAGILADFLRASTVGLLHRSLTLSFQASSSSHIVQTMSSSEQVPEINHAALPTSEGATTTPITSSSAGRVSGKAWKTQKSATV